MKTLLSFLLLVCTLTETQAQNLLFEDFSGAFPPPGWTIDAHSANWVKSPTSQAYGTIPEARLTFNPWFSGTTRLISPPFDLTGIDTVFLDFTFQINNTFNGGTIGVATRNGSGSWNTVLSYDFHQYPSTFNASEELQISNGDVNHSGFQFCLFFNGDTEALTDWFIDNVHLYKQAGHDVCIWGWWTQNWYDTTVFVGIGAPILNRGKDTESFPVVLNIYDFQNNLIHSETKYSENLAPNDPTAITFSLFKFPDADAVYKIQYYTDLPGDMDHYGDTMTRYTTTYSHSRQKVLTELVTSTGCEYCPSAEKGIQEMLSNGDPVAPVAYHPLDYFQRPDGIVRSNYYGYYGTPTAIFDGVIYCIGGYNSASMYHTYDELQDLRQLIRTNFGIELHGTISAGNYNIKAIVTRYAPYINQNLWFQLCLAKVDTAYWWEGADSLFHIERMMVPDAKGTVLDMTNDTTKQLDLIFFYSYPNLSNLELTAFIQDTDTREVLDAVNIKVSDLKPFGTGKIETTSSDNLGNAFPNPMNDMCRLPVTIGNPGTTNLTIYDFRGEKVKTVYEGFLSPGAYDFSWNGTDSNGNLMPDGLYFFRMNKDGATMSRKIILNRQSF
jgi:hypothetical protein